MNDVQKNARLQSPSKDITPLSLQEIVREIYDDFQFPVAFGSARRIYNFLKNMQNEMKADDKLPFTQPNAKIFASLPDISVTEDAVTEALESIEAYVQNKQIRYKGKQLKIVIPSYYHSISVDLMFLDKATKKYNDGYYIILLCVLDFSRKLMARPVKSKHSSVVTAALKDIIENDLKQPPNIIYSDKGGEFADLVNKKYVDTLVIGNFVKDKRRKAITTRHVKLQSRQKAILVERAILRLKILISKYQDIRRSHRWIDNLQNYIDLLNKQPVYSLGGVVPVDVTVDNQQEIIRDIYLPMLKQQFNEFKRQSKKTRLEEGDVVRLVKTRATFRKTGDEDLFTQLYVINQIFPTNPISYQLRLYDDDKVFTTLRRVYRFQLRRVRLIKDQKEELVKIFRNEAFYKGKELYYPAIFKTAPTKKYSVKASEVDDDIGKQQDNDQVVPSQSLSASEKGVGHKPSQSKKREYLVSSDTTEGDGVRLRSGKRLRQFLV